MAHMIMEKDSMFSVNEVPWHRLGVVLPEAPTVEKAIIAAKLNWEVGTKSLYTQQGEVVPALATYRKDDNTVLGVVGSNYKPLQNQEAFNFFQPFLDTKEASLETAGSLRNGQRVWVLAKINRQDSVIVPQADDRVAKYLLLSNSHDGSLAVRVGFSPVRVVCNNTLTAAHNDTDSALIRIKHMGDVVGNLEKVREIMNLADAKFEATAEQYRFLASKQINQKDLEKFVKLVFATKKQQQEAGSIEELTSGNRVLGDIVQLFESGRGNDLPGVKGSYWAAYNATTEYTQYFRGSDESKRLDSLWFGTGAALNKKALEVATEMATAA